MDIRPLNRQNISDIETVILNIFSRPPWNDTWTDDQLHLYVRELMADKNSLSFGLYENQTLIGIALGKIKHWYEGTEYWIEEFGILPEQQRKGVGSRFLKKLEKILTEKGISAFVLVTKRSVPAYFFYQKNGFEEQNDCVLFSKTLIN